MLGIQSEYCCGLINGDLNMHFCRNVNFNIRAFRTAVSCLFIIRTCFASNNIINLFTQLIKTSFTNICAHIDRQYFNIYPHLIRLPIYTSDYVEQIEKPTTSVCSFIGCRLCCYHFSSNDIWADPGFYDRFMTAAVSLALYRWTRATITKTPSTGCIAISTIYEQ